MKLTILINGRPHGTRDWPAVPRVGERVWVGKGSSSDLSEDGFCRVRMVYWRDDNWGVASIACEPDPEPIDSPR